MRCFRSFSWKNSNFRISAPVFDVVTREIIHQRELLEAYISRHPAFRTSLAPVSLLPDPPAIARRMSQAALLTGIGPMAAVAGTIAQMAAEAALREGGADVIVENGGDVFLACSEAVVVGLHAGKAHALGDCLAFSVPADRMPLAVCSSSARMGHSLSLGDCDLATVVARDASLADAAATLACNLVRTRDGIDPALERVAGIAGVDGVLLVKDERVGLAGSLPPLVRSRDPDQGAKVTRDAEAPHG